MRSVDLQETFLKEETPPCLPSFHQERGASHQKPSKSSPSFLSIRGTMDIFLLQQAFLDWIPSRNFFPLPFLDVKAQDHRHLLHHASHFSLEETAASQPGKRLKRRGRRLEGKGNSGRAQSCGGGGSSKWRRVCVRPRESGERLKEGKRDQRR